MSIIQVIKPFHIQQRGRELPEQASQTLGGENAPGQPSPKRPLMKFNNPLPPEGNESAALNDPNQTVFDIDQDAKEDTDYLTPKQKVQQIQNELPLVENDKDPNGDVLQAKQFLERARTGAPSAEASGEPAATATDETGEGTPLEELYKKRRGLRNPTHVGKDGQVKEGVGDRDGRKRSMLEAGLQGLSEMFDPRLGMVRDWGEFAARVAGVGGKMIGGAVNSAWDEQYKNQQDLEKNASEIEETQKEDKAKSESEMLQLKKLETLGDIAYKDNQGKAAVIKAGLDRAEFERKVQREQEEDALKGRQWKQYTDPSSGKVWKLYPASRENPQGKMEPFVDPMTKAQLVDPSTVAKATDSERVEASADNGATFQKVSPRDVFNANTQRAVAGAKNEFENAKDIREDAGKRAEAKAEFDAATEDRKLYEQQIGDYNRRLSDMESRLFDMRAKANDPNSPVTSSDVKSLESEYNQLTKERNALQQKFREADGKAGKAKAKLSSAKPAKRATPRLKTNGQKSNSNVGTVQEFQNVLNRIRR
jgi:outer membrane murein-binding lipoprotein Lpp